MVSSSAPANLFNFAKINMNCDAADGLARDTEATVDTFSRVKALKGVCERVSTQNRRFICNSESSCCILRRTPGWVLHAGKLKPSSGHSGREEKKNEAVRESRGHVLEPEL
ncbi:hypothetical protein TWF569_006121 [Orbilia oligospora]|nr:hypothetical protein TWF569_006121 [Orbilia oligospora]